MSATSYENVPVFRQSSGGYSPQNLIGKANVAVDETNNRYTITIETVGEALPDFLALGELKAFELNTVVQNVDSEKATEYWARQPQ